MSTQKGNIKKIGQKHQNSFSFKHNKNSLLTRKIQETPLDYLCKRCLEILEWKIKYRKYKPLSMPSKCKLCELKTVLKGHREVCDKCAGELLICSKCIEPCEEYAQPTKSSKVLRNKPKDNTFEEILDMLKERQRRTILRKIEDGEDIVFDGNIGLVNKFTGEVVIELSQINNGVLNKNEEKENGEGDSIKEEDKEDNCKDNDEEDEDDQGDIDDEEEN